jgi:hypothetical protein
MSILNKQNSLRLLQHLREDPTNPLASLSLAKGRQALITLQERTMKNYDTMSYQELAIALTRVRGELSLLKFNDIKTERVLHKEKVLKKQLQEIETYRILAKHDQKKCKELSKVLVEQILKSHGVYSDKLHEELWCRLTARNVDVTYTPFVPDITKIRTMFGVRRWLKYKLQTLINWL